jgi:hypothetical protein
MPAKTLQEIESGTEDQKARHQAKILASPDVREETPPLAGPGPSFPAWLKSRTGEGSVDAYLDHPLNLPASVNLARAIRGLTGLLGGLDFAVVDIVLGLVGFLRERAGGGGNVGNRLMAGATGQ